MKKPLIRTAKTAGFCFGVKRALEMVMKALESGKKVYCLGPIIHNRYVLEDLSGHGVRFIENVEDAVDGILIIRSHGVGRDVYEKIESLGIEYADATCPRVRKIQMLAEKLGSSGYELILAGNAEHPEIKGIIGHATGPVFVADTSDELIELTEKRIKDSNCGIALAAQTTYSPDIWKKSVNYLKRVYTNLQFFDTICRVTVDRQAEAKQIALRSQLMLVIGGRDSSNTRKLSDACMPICRTVLLENEDELSNIDFDGITEVGITAGASAPEAIIKKVGVKMSEILNSTEEMSFEEMLEQSFKTIYNGEKVRGVVTAIAPTEIAVDVGTKHAGYVPLNELTDVPG
nr:4-hydroxy-3-methylbut-2-enyl diphosphate reductase [Synergistes sp.]